MPFLSRRHARQRSRGQTLVEFALVLPVLILMLLIALDFGRAFLGWISLNNAARVGANYAALHPNDWDSGTTYEDLMAANVGAINCSQTNPGNAPTFGPTKEPGDLVRVNLDCDFTIVTPIISAVLGGTVTVSSSAAFPISYGCLADCPTGPAAPPPPPPANNCRTAPDVEGLSVAGARNLWVSQGFSAAHFIPSAGPDDTRTVDKSTVTEPPNTEGCADPKFFFDSTMTVTLVDLVTPKPTGCEYVPNMLGVTVADARTTWAAALFTGTFLPATGVDDRIVIQQVTDPSSDPGDCLPPTTAVTVAYGPPLPAPPPQPCKVPSFSNTASTAATGTWQGAGFDPDNISFKPKNKAFTIQSQSLVGGTYVSCDSEIEVRDKP